MLKVIYLKTTKLSTFIWVILILIWVCNDILCHTEKVIYKIWLANANNKNIKLFLLKPLAYFTVFYTLLASACIESISMESHSSTVHSFPPTGKEISIDSVVDKSLAICSKISSLVDDLASLWSGRSAAWWFIDGSVVFMLLDGFCVGKWALDKVDIDFEIVLVIVESLTVPIRLLFSISGSSTSDSKILVEILCGLPLAKTPDCSDAPTVFWFTQQEGSSHNVWGLTTSGLPEPWTSFRSPTFSATPSLLALS